MDTAHWCIFAWLIIVSSVHGSKKKGYGIDLQAFKCGDLDALTNIRWWYNWDSNFGDIETASGCTINDKYLAPFVPMIWSYNPSWPASTYSVDDRNEFILGFNEPNHISQANLSPQVAADNWHIIENAAKGKMLIVSPAAAPCGGGATNCISDTFAWFDDFFRILCGIPDIDPVVPCRVHYLATHYYSCNVQSTMTFLQQLYGRYGLEIWLTEFACPNSVSPLEQLDYMTDLLPLLEEADYVYRYAWYVHRRAAPDTFISEHANLFETGTSVLTELGQYYNNFQVEEPAPASVCRANRK